MTEPRKATATVRIKMSRDGRTRTCMHTVLGYQGEVAGTRKSEHRYQYAVCRRVPGHFHEDGQARVQVIRWTNNNKCKSSEFTLPVSYVGE